MMQELLTTLHTKKIHTKFLGAGFSIFLIIILLFQLFLYSGLISAQEDKRNVYKELNAPFYDPYGIADACGDSGAPDDISGVAPGSGDPEGLTFPNLSPDDIANAIEQYIQQVRPTSPFKGLGAIMVATGKKSNVNPFLFVAIALKETQLATDNSYNIQPGRYNAFGRTATERQPHFSGDRLWYKWVSFRASVDYKHPSHAVDPSKTGDMGKYIRAVYASYLNANDVGEFFLKYAPAFENDTTQYVNQVKGWMKSMADIARDGPAAGPATVNPEAGTPAGAEVPAECQPCGPDSGKQVIVIDPGHAGAGSAMETDPVTGIQAIEVPNPEERSAMWDAAQTIKTTLESNGYKVVLTKNAENDKAGLLKKAQRANAANAALVVSLHSTPGRFGTVPTEHWGVTPQEVGRFRENKDNGKRKTFTNESVATKSMQYAQIIAEERNKTGDATKVTPLDRSFPRDRAGIQAWGDISLVQLFGTAPWVYNEVGQTGYNGQKYAEGIANGIMKAIPVGASDPTADAGCVNGAVNGDIIATALNYAWPEYHAAPYTVMKPAYKLAVEKAIAAGKYVGGGPKPGIDCGGFVTRVMQDSGADPAYGGGGNTIYQKAHMDNSGKYEKITVGSTADLQPGDIAIDATHTFMYVGTQPNFETKVASASYSTSGVSWRTPMAGQEDVMSSRWSWYRLK